MAMAGSADSEDPREEELASIASIWPELIQENGSYRFILDMPVSPTDPILLSFAAGSQIQDERSAIDYNSALHVIAFDILPPIRLQFELPEGYPQHTPPLVSVSSHPDWLPADTKHAFEERIIELWEMSYHDQILYAFIDSIQVDVDAGMHFATTPLVQPQLRIELLDFQARAEKEQFSVKTFDCGVCLAPKKGSACYKMGRCGHIFCKGCLVNFYSTCIQEGDVSRVQCMDFDCGFLSETGRKVKPSIAPAELLQIPISFELVQRYAELRRKKQIEADKSIVYCPRKWCQAPARSEKYPMLTDLSLMTEADDIVDVESAPQLSASSDFTERLRICEKCTYAFCRVCKMSWHGDLKRCKSRDVAEISKEEQATIAFIRRHTSECPVCVAPVQKSMGCNHMTCFQCKTHFCYLCANWLFPNNPYIHFNVEGQPCYQRLWDLEEGDNGDGRVQFVGARALEMDAFAQDGPPAGNG